MDYLGEISSDLETIDRKLWLKVVREHPNLVAPKPKHGINPFTKEPMVFKARKDVAGVVIDGKDVGTIWWSENGSDCINVFGDTREVIAIAEDVAKRLGCRFEGYEEE